jgi:DNA polymerase-3 subunit gamma/tau
MSEYRVLARKYRPKDFNDLIGQEVLVRTLSNAISQNRLAHAFLLTGIRGIGKTTTARIIAKALNCIGVDGTGGATIQPCGVCSNCVAITQDRHLDVMEMDAASRTGVDDIRELIETVHYAPTNARYKIYIIDEVHMLSKSAFNALLKTLEEPPPHVKFVFATTEIRKIPVTILSRCQRFDLKRIQRDELAQHLQNICTKEQVTADAEALTCIANAAEGSVRDALSLLDQAIAHAGEGDAIHISQNLTATMLGLADRSGNYTLLEKLFGGDVAGAIAQLREQYAAGSDPSQILQEVLELVHHLTLLKSNTTIQDASFSPEQETVLKEMASKMPMTMLTRSWQILLKGLQECQLAQNPLMAAEMVLIRLGYLSDLPSPEDLIRKLQSEGASARGAGQGGVPSGLSPAPVARLVSNSSGGGNYGGHAAAVAVSTAPLHEVVTSPMQAVAHNPENFDEVLALFAQKKEMLLHRHLDRDASLVQFQLGSLELNFNATVPQDIPNKVAQKLTEWTGKRWMISLSQAQGEPSRYATRQAAEEAERSHALAHPLVQEVLQMFAGSKLVAIVSA